MSTSAPQSQEASRPTSPESASQHSLTSWDGWSRAASRMWSKLRLADHARLMMDNQRVLNMTAAADQVLRQRRQKFSDARMGNMSSEPTAPDPTDDMKVSIDSPITENHYHSAAPAQAPAAPTAVRSLASRLAPWVVGPLIGAGGVGVGTLINRPTAPTPAPAHDDLRWRLVIPDEPKGTQP